MIMRDACPQCGSTWYKRNGHIHTGKQNHRCKVCGRALVRHPENQVITEEQRMPIARLLLERISLRGICRAVGVSRTWLLHFMVRCFAACPEDLYVRLPKRPTDVVLRRLEAEADEMWSFVKRKAHKLWVWIAMDAMTRQIIAFHVGDRSRKSATALWATIPLVYRNQAVFHTDQYDAYTGVMPAERHKAITKHARKTNHIERCNNTLRQGVSRLVRETLSFSKKLAPHIGMIKYFICNYNLTRAAVPALPVQHYPRMSHSRRSRSRGGSTAGSTLAPHRVTMAGSGSTRSKTGRATIDIQKMNWKFRAGVHEQTGVCLNRHCGHNGTGGYTRERQNTGQCCDCQSFTCEVATGLSQRRCAFGATDPGVDRPPGAPRTHGGPVRALGPQLLLSL